MHRNVKVDVLTSKPTFREHSLGKEKAGNRPPRDLSEGRGHCETKPASTERSAEAKQP